MTSGVSLFNGRILSRVEPPSLLQLVAASLYLHSNNIAKLITSLKRFLRAKEAFLETFLNVSKTVQNCQKVHS